VCLRRHHCNVWIRKMTVGQRKRHSYRQSAVVAAVDNAARRHKAPDRRDCRLVAVASTQNRPRTVRASSASLILRYCIETNTSSVTISSPTESPKTLGSSQNSKGSSRARALNETGVGTNWRFPTFTPPYLRNGVREDQGCCRSPIGSRICVSDWYRN